MSGWIDAFFYFMTGAAVLLSVMGLWFTVTIPGIDRWSKHFFRAFFIILLLSGVFVLTGLILRDYPVPSAAFYFFLIPETLLLSLPLPMQMIYLLHFCGEILRSNKLLHAVFGLWSVFFILLVIVPFVDGFIHVTPENRYFRGPLYPLLLTPMIAVLLLNFIHTMRSRARLSRKAFLSFIIAQVPMAVMLIVNLFFDAVPLFDISYVLSALAMYSFILSDQIEQDRDHQREIARQQQEITQQQREIAHERASVMVLQMRPHFIYNTLLSIYSLCKSDPEKARQITMDFTNYLRSNFNAIASDSSIPFFDELKHTRAYLAVEKAQYDDMLDVDYDIRFTNFRIPPLTIQPIVENAVKHGMDPDSEPLHLSIRTRYTDAGAEIIVEDTGPGFDPSDESVPHTTLTNIRQRLKIMCSGTMTITCQTGKGTVVKIIIPDSAAI